MAISSVSGIRNGYISNIEGKSPYMRNDIISFKTDRVTLSNTSREKIYKANKEAATAHQEEKLAKINQVKKR